MALVGMVELIASRTAGRALRYVEPVDSIACKGVGPYHTSIDVYSFSIITWELATCESAMEGLGFLYPRRDMDELALAISDGARPPIDGTMLRRYGEEVAQLLRDC